MIELGYQDGDNPKGFSADQQMMILKNETERTGCFHEAQLNQIRGWPIALNHKIQRVIASPNLEEYELSYTFEGAGLTREQCALLERSIKWMLGNKWSINITVAGRRIFPDTNPVQKIPLWVRIWLWVHRILNAPKRITGK